MCHMTHLYPREAGAQMHTKTLMQMFIVALLIMVPNWKEPKYPSAEERINKL